MKLSSKFLLLSGLAFAFTGCAQSEFAGNNNKSKPKPPVQDPSVPEQASGSSSTPPAENPPSPLDCDPAKAVTTVKLLTTAVIENNAANQSIRYEIGVLCDGKPMPIKGSAIWFDLDSSNNNVLSSSMGLPYKISDAASGQLVGNGQFKSVQGADLFGNSGMMFFHYESDVVTLPNNQTRILLEIDVSNQTNIPRENPDFTAKVWNIASYLRYGEAQAVQQGLQFTAVTDPGPFGL